MKFSEWSEKNAPALALIVALIALGVSLWPHVKPLVVEPPEPKQMPMPMPGMGMPGMGMPGMGGGPGMGMGMRMGGIPPKPDPDYLAKLQERVDLLKQILAEKGTQSAEELNYALDLAKMDLIRAKKRGYNAAAGAAEALLHEREAAAKYAKEATLAAKEEWNRAEIALAKAVGKLRNSEKFKEIAETLKNYPAEPVSDETLILLIDSENLPHPVPTPGRGGPGPMPGAPVNPGNPANPPAPHPAPAP